MRTQRQRRMRAAGVVAAASLTAACGNSGDPADQGEGVTNFADIIELSEFSSIGDLYDAVDDAVGCDEGMTAEPVEFTFDIYTPEYAMCTGSLQLVLYQSWTDREKVHERIVQGGENSPDGFAEGENWHAFKLPRPESAGPADVQSLAEELGGVWVQIGGTDS